MDPANFPSEGSPALCLISVFFAGGREKEKVALLGVTDYWSRGVTHLIRLVT